MLAVIVEVSVLGVYLITGWLSWRPRDPQEDRRIRKNG